MWEKQGSEGDAIVFLNYMCRTHTFCLFILIKILNIKIDFHKSSRKNFRNPWNYRSEPTGYFHSWNVRKYCISMETCPPTHWSTLASSCLLHYSEACCFVNWDIKLIIYLMCYLAESNFTWSETSSCFSLSVVSLHGSIKSNWQETWILYVWYNNFFSQLKTLIPF